MDQIVIHGFYGMGNLGDEAILTALLKAIQRNRNTTITVVSRNPKQVKLIHGVKAIKETGIRSLVQRIWSIKRSRLFLFGGGGLLKDYGEDSTDLIKWLEPVQMATSMKRKTALVAMGVENIRYEQSKKALRAALNKVDLITVRDRNSKAILEAIGVKKKISVVSDPAILLCKTPNIKRIKKTNPKVMVCMRHWYDKGHYISNAKANQKMLQTLGQALDYLIRNYNADIDFWPLRTTVNDDDRKVADQIAESMNSHKKVRIYRSVPNVSDFVQMMNLYSMVIGMRLHSIIIAAASGIPVIGLNYMPKVAAFMESIQQEQYLVEPETINIDNLICLINRIFDSHQQISNTLVSKISKLQKVTEESINQILGSVS